jgi:hypothetical protein
MMRINFKKILIAIVFILLNFNLPAQKDSIVSTKKLSFKVGVRNVFIGVPPFVVRFECNYHHNQKLNFGIISYYTDMISPSIRLLYQMNNIKTYKYILEESPQYFLTNNKPMSHFGIGLKSEYNFIDRKKFALSIQPSLLYSQGYTGGKVLYRSYVSNYVSSAFLRYFELYYFKDISVDLSLRYIRKVSDTFYWSLAWYYTYIPTVVQNQTMFTGWLLELDFRSIDLKIRNKNKNYEK